MPQRFSAQVARYAAARSDQDVELPLPYCLASLDRIRNATLCHLGSAKSGKPDFILWGDSHAVAIAPAFQALAKQNGTMGWLASHPGCPPLLGVARTDRDIHGCTEYNDAVLSTIEREDIPIVILAARWDINVLGRTSWELFEGLPQAFVLDAESKKAALSGNRAVFERGLRRTLTRLAARHCQVVLLVDVPNTLMDTPVFLARGASRSQIGQEARTNVAAYDREEKSVDSLLAQLGEEFHVTLVNPKPFLCIESNCMIAKDGNSLYRDDNHLTVFGALQLVNLLREGLQRSVPPG